MTIVLLAHLAFADAIGMGPPECPSGSTPASSHCGEWCAPSTCAPAIPAPCGDGFACESAGLCMHPVFHPGEGCGNVQHRGLDPIAVPNAVKSCTSTADCAPGDTCEIVDRCVEARVVPPPVIDGSGSASGGLSCPFAVGVPLLGLGMLGLVSSKVK